MPAAIALCFSDANRGSSEERHAVAVTMSALSAGFRKIRTRFGDRSLLIMNRLPSCAHME
ncbi:hypothetical protein GCM10020216_074420 [Nonomuraea helvata]